MTQRKVALCTHNTTGADDSQAEAGDVCSAECEAAEAGHAQEHHQPGQ